MLPHAFFDALFPLLAGLATNPARLNQMFRRVIIGLMVFGILFGIGISLVANPLISLSYGERFSPAIAILMVLAWSLLPMLLKGGRTLFWYAKGQEQYVNIVTGIVIVFQIMIAFWLIPAYGVSGAAYTMILAESSAVILLFMRRS